MSHVHSDIAMRPLRVRLMPQIQKDSDCLLAAISESQFVLIY